jgi:hypothetical protein
MADEAETPSSSSEPSRSISAWNPPAVSSSQLRSEAKIARAQEKVRHAEANAVKANARFQTIQNKVAVRSSHASARLLKVQGRRELAKLKADIALEKYQAKLEEDERKEELAKKGLRTQWLTGRVVPVKKSKTGAVAHMRSKPSKWSFFGRPK